MKILLLNYEDSSGGAAISTLRLLFGLKKSGIDIKLGVLEKKTSNDDVVVLTRKSIVNDLSFLRKVLSGISGILLRVKRMFGIKFRTSNPILHSENKKSLIDINYLNNSDYDLIHMHWINRDMISIEDIAKIKKPIIWTMHDSWVFCGAEHHPNFWENDKRYITGYTRKNKPKTSSGPDICRKTWLRKMKSWSHCHFDFISPSNFEREMFFSSMLSKNNDCAVIPNIIPSDIFRPINKDLLKDIYKIPQDKKIIGFGAAFDIKTEKSIKGGYLLLESLKMIKRTDDYFFILFGNVADSFIKEIPIKTFSTGYIENSFILSSMYNLCDVFVCPSVVENLPNTCLEALFCGVPVAAFNTGGIPDIVEHLKTGYLATLFNTKELYEGILYCIDNYEKLSKDSLRKAKNDFGEKKIIQKHISLYKDVLERRK